MPLFVILWCVWVFLPAPVGAESTKALVDNGNQFYQAGDYEKALEEYSAALQNDPASPYLHFNRGNVLYKLENYKEALEEYDKVLAAQPDDLLTAKSKYNIGNALFRLAEQALQTDAGKALQNIEESESYYRQALERSPRMTEAAKNIEIARLKAMQIEKMMQARKQVQAEPQPGTEQSQQNEQAAALNDLAEEQRNQAQKSAQAAQDRSSMNPAEATQQSEELADSQQTIRQNTERLSEKMSGPQEQFPEAAEKLKQAVAEQLAAEKNLQQGEFAEANEDQQEALQNMQEALAAMNSSKEPQDTGNNTADKQSQTHDDTAQQQEQRIPGRQDTPPGGDRPREAMAPDKTAHDILGQEKRNRQLRRKDGQTGMTGVEKDW